MKINYKAIFLIFTLMMSLVLASAGCGKKANESGSSSGKSKTVKESASSVQSESESVAEVVSQPGDDERDDVLSDTSDLNSSTSDDTKSPADDEKNEPEEKISFPPARIAPAGAANKTGIPKQTEYKSNETASVWGLQPAPSVPSGMPVPTGSLDGYTLYANNENNMRFIGSTAVENGVVMLSGEGSGFKLSFNGTRLDAQFQSDPGSASELAYLGVVIDGDNANILRVPVSPGGWITLLFEQTNGNHTVEITRLSDAPGTSVGLIAIRVPNGEYITQPPGA